MNVFHYFNYSRSKAWVATMATDKPDIVEIPEDDSEHKENHPKKPPPIRSVLVICSLKNQLFTGLS